MNWPRYLIALFALIAIAEGVWIYTRSRSGEFLDYDLYLESVHDAYRMSKQAERFKERLAEVCFDHACELREMRQKYEDVVAMNHTLAGQLVAAEAENHLKGEA